MTDWARISVGFYRHPRTRRLSKDAQHLYIASILHCVEFGTDGRFPADEIPLLASISRVRSSQAEELLQSGAWIANGDEYEVRDFLQHQTPAEVVRARSNAAKLAAEARWGKKKSGEPPPNGTANGNAIRNANGKADRNASRGEESREDPSSLPDQPDDGFEAFWSEYPRRDGKKVGKAKAHGIWKRMSAAKRSLAMSGVSHYAASGWMPQDAHRWLRDEVWNDWQEPAVRDEPKPPKQVVG